MSFIFYDLSKQTAVDFVERRGTAHVELKAISEVGQPCTIVHRDDLLFLERDVYVLDSTKSGPVTRTEDSGFYGRILRPLFDDLFEIKHTYVATTSAESIKQFASSLSSNGRKIMVIIIGGDTSIGEFVNSLSSNATGSIDLFVVPAGTGNSLALSLGITDERTAMERLFYCSERDVSPLQLYQASFPQDSYLLGNTGEEVLLSSPILFVVVASWAFHASLVADSDTEEMRKHGIGRFKLAAHQNLSRPQKYDGTVTIKQENGTKITREGPLAYLVITPSQKFEPTFNISPNGNIFNSDLYVVGFNFADDESYIMDIMTEVYNNGNHVSDERVFYDQVTENSTVTLALGYSPYLNRRRFCIDGAIVVVPDKQDNVVTVGYHGSEVHGWNLNIVR